MTERLKSLFRASHETLRAQLLGASVVAHPGEKGCASENDWRSFLGNHLPERYAVDSAFIVDSQGNQSEQIDVVVYDRQYSPLFLDRGGVRFLPAESVYAVFEVKQSLSKQHLQYAGEKVASVRRLYRTSGEIVDRGERRDARPLPRILGGLLASVSTWNPPLGGPFQRTLRTLSEERQIDLGCAVDAGAFEVAGDGTDAVRTVDDGSAMMFFLLALLRRLQSIGTVPAIDWAAYEACIEDSDG